MGRAALFIAGMLGLLSVALTGPAAEAAPRFDFHRHVVAELGRPNVRLVAVVFSASWCEPCLAEQEGWKRLKAMYGARGLRLVVVRYKDAAARMKVYDWPDVEVWDDDGRIGDAFGVRDQLPAAFLWSWEGKLLARKKTVQDIASRINDHLRRSPRVVVKATEEDGQTPLPTLQALVESELMRLGKFDVVVSQADRERMDELRRASHAPNRSDRERCKLGLEMSPNSLVTATPMGGRLILALKDIERACLVQSVAIPINPDNLPGTVAEAAAGLVASVRIDEVEQPGARPLTPGPGPAEVREAERTEGGTVDDFSEAGTWQTMLLRSNPPGATVRLEEKAGQVKRPDQGEDIVRWRLKGGSTYTAVFEMPLYKPERVSFTVEEGKREVFADLTPDFGNLRVLSVPAGADVFINGASEGKTPLLGKLIQARESVEVEVTHPCFKPYRITGLQLQAGEQREERVELVPKLALVEIVLTDADSRQKGGVLYADDHRLGSTDEKHRVSVCTQKLKVVPNDSTLSSWEEGVNLEPGEVREFSVRVGNREHVAKEEKKRSEWDRLIEDDIAPFYFTMDGGTVEETGLQLTQLTWSIQPWAWNKRSVFLGFALTLGEETVSTEGVLGYQWWVTTWLAPYIRGQIGHSKTAPDELAAGTEAGLNVYALKDLMVLRTGVKWSHEHGVYGFLGAGVSWKILGLLFR